MEKLGIPTAEEYALLYAKRTRQAAVDPAVWNFYLIFNVFRLAAILQGIAKREVDGNASSDDAAATGLRAVPLAELAWGWATERLGAR